MDEELKETYYFTRYVTVSAVVALLIGVDWPSNRPLTLIGAVWISFGSVWCLLVMMRYWACRRQMRRWWTRQPTSTRQRFER